MTHAAQADEFHGGVLRQSGLEDWCVWHSGGDHGEGGRSEAMGGRGAGVVALAPGGLGRPAGVFGAKRLRRRSCAGRRSSCAIRVDLGRPCPGFQFLAAGGQHGLVTASDLERSHAATAQGVGLVVGVVPVLAGPRFDGDFGQPLRGHFIHAAAMVAFQDQAQVAHLEPQAIGGGFAMELRRFVQNAANHEVQAGPVRFVGFVHVGGVGRTVHVAVNVAQEHAGAVAARALRIPAPSDRGCRDHVVPTKPTWSGTMISTAFALPVPDDEHGGFGGVAFADDVEEADHLFHEPAGDARVAHFEERCLTRQFAGEVLHRHATAEERRVAAEEQPVAAEQVKGFSSSGQGMASSSLR